METKIIYNFEKKTLLIINEDGTASGYSGNVAIEKAKKLLKSD